ncbi:MAG: MFS transporter, partial [Anaerolineae bacterium]|nr:MFS transporter [Anaerolineae bacterium]
EGILADRTRTPLGRRRPYLLFGIPFVFLSFFLLFYPVAFTQEVFRLVYALFSYLFFSTVVSIVMLNYTALQSELSLDYHQRTLLGASRISFSTLSSMLCAVLPLQIVGAFPDVRAGWVAVGAGFGLFFALPFIATVIAARERPEFQKPPRPFRWQEAFLEPFQVRAFVYALFMYLLAFVAMDAVSSIVVYFMKNYLHRPGETSFVNGTVLVTQILSLPFYVWLSRRTSKQTGYVTGALVWMMAMTLSFFITPDSPRFLPYLLAASIGLGTGGIVGMMYSIFPDIPDVDELRTGQRREGIYFALVTFARKVSSALALFLVAQAIQLAGYIPPRMEVVEGLTRLVEQPQSPTFILTLRLLFGLTPIFLLTIAILFALRYPLNPQVHARLRAVLERKRAGESVDEAEILPLTRSLIG